MILRVTTLLDSDVQCSTKNQTAYEETGKYGPLNGKNNQQKLSLKKI